MRASKRPVLRSTALRDVLDSVEERWKYRIHKWGDHTFVSRHEILGVVLEEVRELEEATHSGHFEDIEEELTDVVVACLHGLASLYSYGVDW